MRKAYLQRSRENHPDKNPDMESAEERMAEITHANKILSNDVKKSVYDGYGSKVNS